MTLEFGAPKALWLLSLLPVVWFAGRAGVRPGTWSSIARLLLLSSLIAALAQPVLRRPATRTALVYLVDASHSVSTRALDSGGASQSMR